MDLPAAGAILSFVHIFVATLGALSDISCVADVNHLSGCDLSTANEGHKPNLSNYK